METKTPVVSQTNLQANSQAINNNIRKVNSIEELMQFPEETTVDARSILVILNKTEKGITQTNRKTGKRIRGKLVFYDNKKIARIDGIEYNPREKEKPYAPGEITNSGIVKNPILMQRNAVMIQINPEAFEIQDIYFIRGPETNSKE